ncbi:MAG: NUDIX hydrolase [Selenomonadaceae bacterium]|nr:NUDIX hydrolase [Selenomonadaceae bacterium]
MVRLPNGHEAVREWIKHPGASAVVPILPNGDVILVRQFRYPIGKVTLEVPAGKLDKPGEDPILCAERELSEETGYVAKKIWKLTTIATSFGFSDEWIHLYAAKDLTKGQQHPDEDEFINVVKMPLDDAVALIHEGKIYDSKSVVSILMLAEQLKNS